MFLIFDLEAFYKGQSFPCVLVLFLLYGISSLPQTYIISFFFSDQNKALLWCIASYATQGFVYFFVSFILERMRGTAEDVNDILQYFFLLYPQYCISYGLYKLWEDYWTNDGSGDPWDYDISGKMVIFMTWETFVLWFLLFYLQYRSTNQQSQEVEDVDQEELEWDQDVTDEAALVDAGTLDPASNPIIVQHLRKIYWTSGQRKPKVAVKDLSFHVPEGEVFGFLGINGAGKTSSLAILTGEFLPTSGSATLCGLNMFEHRDTINSQIGYCPQFDALFEHMTGREHLELYARLKGVPEDQV
jgi:ATP-binding cassette subfamily A (ABC1) protein 1